MLNMGTCDAAAELPDMLLLGMELSDNEGELESTMEGDVVVNALSVMGSSTAS